MLKYLIFLIFGIIFYILYNSKDTFSVGAQTILSENESGCEPGNEDYVVGNECDGRSEAGLACFNNVCINPCRNTNVNKICANDLCNGLEDPVMIEPIGDGVCLGKKCQSFNTISNNRDRQRITDNPNIISYKDPYTNRVIFIHIQFDEQRQIDWAASRANMSICGEFSIGHGEFSIGHAGGCGPAESPEEKCNHFSLDCVDGECLKRGGEGEQCRNIDRVNRCVDQDGDTDPNLRCEMLNNNREYCIRRGNYHERCRDPDGDELRCNTGFECILVPPTEGLGPTLTEWCVDSGGEEAVAAAGADVLPYPQDVSVEVGGDVRVLLRPSLRAGEVRVLLKIYNDSDSAVDLYWSSSQLPSEHWDTTIPPGYVSIKDTYTGYRWVVRRTSQAAPYLEGEFTLTIGGEQEFHIRNRDPDAPVPIMNREVAPVAPRSFWERVLCGVSFNR